MHSKSKRRLYQMGSAVLVLAMLLLTGLACLFQSNLVYAAAQADPNIVIQDAVLVDSNGVAQTDGAVKIGINDKRVSITIKSLLYPGAGATFRVTTKNTGGQAAKCTSSDSTLRFDALIVQQDAPSQTVLEPGGTQDIYFTLQWDPESVDSFGQSVTVSESFAFDLNYEAAAPGGSGGGAVTPSDPGDPSIDTGDNGFGIWIVVFALDGILLLFLILLRKRKKEEEWEGMRI